MCVYVCLCATVFMDLFLHTDNCAVSGLYPDRGNVEEGNASQTGSKNKPEKRFRRGMATSGNWGCEKGQTGVRNVLERCWRERTAVVNVSMMCQWGIHEKALR